MPPQYGILSLLDEKIVSILCRANVDILPRLSSPLGGKAEDSSLEFRLDRYGTFGFLRKPDCERGTSLVFAFPAQAGQTNPHCGNCTAANQPPIPERLSLFLHRLIAHRKIIRETRLAKPPRCSLKQEKQKSKKNSSGAPYIPAPFERGLRRQLIKK